MPVFESNKMFLSNAVLRYFPLSTWKQLHVQMKSPLLLLTEAWTLVIGNFFAFNGIFNDIGKFSAIN